MPSRQDLNSLISQLKDLAASSPTQKSELAAWYKRARKCEDFLTGRSDLPDIPHDLWHYLADADIRVKSPEYREAQQARVAEIIEMLENVDIPVDAA